MSERTALYRLFGADDALLYVGIAMGLGRRWDQHAEAQPWWPEVDHQTVRWFPTREDAEKAEVEAIHAEHPVYNVVHNQRPAIDKETGFPEPPKWEGEQRPIAVARANLTELIALTRLKRVAVAISRRGKPQAALVPVELADAADAAGGMDAAVAILRKAAEQ